MECPFNEENIIKLTKGSFSICGKANISASQGVNVISLTNIRTAVLLVPSQGFLC